MASVSASFYNKKNFRNFYIKFLRTATLNNDLRQRKTDAREDFTFHE